VLGHAGINFAAGMTGGVAWMYDADGSFVAEPRFHPDFVTPEAFAEVDEVGREALHELISRHAAEAESGLAKTMLADWGKYSAGFVRLNPKPQV
jgi:glutamate synthase (ferredoxin)